MMKNVALVALIAAPAALAFTPENLAGVWSCKTLDKWIWTKGFPVTDDGADPDYQQPTGYDDDTESLRVIVFDEPKSDAVRRFSGRQYWLDQGEVDCIEEHDFHGLLTSAIDGTYYLDPNAANQECSGGTLHGGQVLALNTYLDVPSDDPLETGSFADGSTCGIAQCRKEPAGPWEFTFDDADHFTLSIDPSDSQRTHLTDDPTHLDNTVDAVVTGLEKCVRGLLEESQMCNRLKRSDINSDDEMDAACQGTLVCASCDDDDDDIMCCSVPKPEQPVYAPQPYYYPPQFYPQQQWSYNPYSSPYYGYGR